MIGKAAAFFAQCQADRQQIYIPAQSLTEFLCDYDKEKRRQSLAAIARGFHIAPLDAKAAIIAAELQANWNRLNEIKEEFDITKQRMNDYRFYLASMVALGLGGVCLGAVAMAAMWAALGGPPSITRMVAALLVAAVLGLLPPCYFPALLSDDFAASVAITTLEALFVTGTLAVVRARGYRLLALTRSSVVS